MSEHQDPQFEGMENQPIEQRENHGAPHEPKPPVGQLVVELLDAVEFVLLDGVMHIVVAVGIAAVLIVAHVS